MDVQETVDTRLFNSFCTATGPLLLGSSCCPMKAPGLVSCSVTLCVFDKLSWTLNVEECQFVKYPKRGTCLAAAGQGQTNGLLTGYENVHQTPSSWKFFSVTLK